jgi:hypothetical protein
VRDTAAAPAPKAMEHAGAEHEMMHGAGPAGLPASVQLQLLRDPVIRRRVLADAPLRRRWLESVRSLPENERVELQRLLTPAPAVRR